MAARRRNTLGAVAIAFALLMLLPPLAAFAGGHRYSIAYEDGEGRGYTGVKGSHYVLDLDVNDCDNVIYQTMWLMWKSDASEWVEVGTYYCNSARYNFVYYRDPPSCGYTQIWSNPSLGAHSFKIERRDSNHDLYDITIDGDVVQTVGYTESATGIVLSTGLESYNDTKTVNDHAYYSLKKKRWDNSFVDWTGQDNQFVNTPVMCGQWVSDTSWRAGENTSC